MGQQGPEVEGAEAVAKYGGKAAGWAFGKDARFDAGDLAGGYLRNTIGDESTGWAAGSAVSDALSGAALGTAAGVLAGGVTEAKP